MREFTPDFHGGYRNSSHRLGRWVPVRASARANPSDGTHLGSSGRAVGLRSDTAIFRQEHSSSPLGLMAIDRASVSVPVPVCAGEGEAVDEQGG